VGSVGSVGSFSHYLVYLETIIFFFYTALKCLLAPLLKTYPCEAGCRGKSTTGFYHNFKLCKLNDF
jgi:hypothetical protein